MKNRKHCSACKNDVLLSGFNKNVSNQPSGLQGECRECQNKRARDRNRKKATAKRLKKILVEDMVKKQVVKDRMSDQELGAKDIFLKHVANYMRDNNADYRCIAKEAGYSKATVSSYLNWPEKVSEQFIRQCSKKIPGLSREWGDYRERMGLSKISNDPVTPALEDDRYVILVDDEILEKDMGGMTETECKQALDEYLTEQELAPRDCVIEVFKLVKMGYELNIMHDLTIYSSFEAR